MSNSRNPMSKFTLRPSSLSQHTANFNKLLEQVPAPKIDHLELIKPHLDHKPDSNSEQTPVLPESKPDEKEAKQETVVAPPAKEFVFGEKLNDRVINTPAEDVAAAAASSQNGVKTSEEATSSQTGAEVGGGALKASSSSLWSDNDAEKYSVDSIENTDANTLLKLNCKLYILETDKMNWLERGYGILKVIDSNDGINYKIMMWTDKTFRLILNTKLFEKMQIDRANKKSIRFNGYDNGTIRIFLVKAANPNDADELQAKLQIRLDEFNANMSKQASYDNSSAKDEVSSTTTPTNTLANKKNILLKCPCDVFTNNDQVVIHAKLHVYNIIPLSTAENLPSSTSHQLLLDIVDETDEAKILLSSYLKLVKVRKSSDERLEFEINESFNLSASKSKSKVVISEQEPAQKLLSLYAKEPKFRLNPDDSSNEAEDDDEDDDDSENEESDEETEASGSKSRLGNEEMSRKRKIENSLSQENIISYKKQELETTNEEEERDEENEETTKSSKRLAEDVDDDQSNLTAKEIETQLKKNKVSETNEDES